MRMQTGVATEGRGDEADSTKKREICEGKENGKRE